MYVYVCMFSYPSLLAIVYTQEFSFSFLVINIFCGHTYTLAIVMCGHVLLMR